MVCLGNEPRSFFIFQVVPKYCILDSFVDCDGYSISPKGFLTTVVDMMVIWVKFTQLVYFHLLVSRMSMFTLAISYLTTSNLPWFMDLTFQVPMQYCSLQHQTLLSSPVSSTTGCCFCFALSLHSFWSYFSTDLQSHIGHLPTWGVHLSVSYLFAFSYCSWGSQGKNTEVVCHSFLQWTMFCQNSPPWPVHLGWLYMAWLVVSLS